MVGLPAPIRPAPLCEQLAQAPRDLLVDGARAVVVAKPRGGGSFCKVGDVVDVVQADSIQQAGAPR
jgi:hypothetical protein